MSSKSGPPELRPLDLFDAGLTGVSITRSILRQSNRGWFRLANCQVPFDFARGGLEQRGGLRTIHAPVGALAGVPMAFINAPLSSLFDAPTGGSIAVLNFGGSWLKSTDIGATYSAAPEFLFSNPGGAPANHTSGMYFTYSSPEILSKWDGSAVSSLALEASFPGVGANAFDSSFTLAYHSGVVYMAAQTVAAELYVIAYDTGTTALSVLAGASPGANLGGGLGLAISAAGILYLATGDSATQTVIYKCDLAAPGWSTDATVGTILDPTGIVEFSGELYMAGQAGEILQRAGGAWTAVPGAPATAGAQVRLAVCGDGVLAGFGAAIEVWLYNGASWSHDYVNAAYAAGPIGQPLSRSDGVAVYATDLGTLQRSAAGAWSHTESPGPTIVYIGGAGV